MKMRRLRAAAAARLPDPTLIPGVHRFCDEWCAHCPVTHGCLAYRLRKDYEQQHGAAHEMSLAEMIQFTRDIAAAEGRTTPELDALTSPDPTVRAAIPQADDPLTRLAARYAMEVSWYLHSCGWTPPDSPDAPNPSRLDVIAWYHAFIALRIGRAATGILQAACGRPDRLEDALGCAKLVLVSLDRSREALEGLQRESREPYLGRVLETLGELERTTERRFPAARTFARPGLDTPSQAVAALASRGA